MKKIIGIIFLSVLAMCFCSESKAQNASTFYDTCFAMRQFEGEWRHTNGQDTIKVYFRVNNFYSQPNNFVGGEILGWHEYKSGNTIIQSDFMHRFDVLPSNFSQKAQIICSIGLVSGVRGSICEGILGNLYGGMKDYNIDRGKNWKITRISQNAIQVYQIMAECHITATNACPTGFTLPQTFILTKQ